LDEILQAAGFAAFIAIVRAVDIDYKGIPRDDIAVLR
jgi:hypothetical protein